MSGLWTIDGSIDSRGVSRLVFQILSIMTRSETWKPPSCLWKSETQIAARLLDAGLFAARGRSARRSGVYHETEKHARESESSNEDQLRPSPLRPSFCFEKGIFGRSHAFDAALRCGVSVAVVGAPRPSTTAAF